MGQPFCRGVVTAEQVEVAECLGRLLEAEGRQREMVGPQRPGLEEMRAGVDHGPSHEASVEKDGRRMRWPAWDRFAAQ
jgi:hypothetical protein